MIISRQKNSEKRNTKSFFEKKLLNEVRIPQEITVSRLIWQIDHVNEKKYVAKDIMILLYLMEQFTFLEL